MTGSTGCLFVHACPPSLRAASEAAIGLVLPHLTPLQWVPRDGVLSATAEWCGRAGSAAAMAAGLRSLGAVVFELTEDASQDTDGERLCFVPGLGLYRSATNAVGDVVVDENQLAAALRDSPNAEALRELLSRLMGRPWDEALEPMRMRAWAPAEAAATG